MVPKPHAVQRQRERDVRHQRRHGADGQRRREHGHGYTDHRRDRITGTLTVTKVTNDDGCPATVSIGTPVTFLPPPTFSTCPAAPVTANTAPNQCLAAVAYTVTATGDPSPTLTYAFTGATSGSGPGTGSGSNFNKGNTTVTVTATSACGMSDCVFTVIVSDLEPPAITCPTGSPFARNTDPIQCDYTVQGTEFDPTAFGDNCPGATITNDFNNSTSLADEDLPKGSHTITWTVTDGMNMASTTCQIMVNVTDNQPPVVTCPADQTVTPSSAGDCTGAYTIADPLADNCPGATWGYSASGATMITAVTGIADGTGSGALTFNLGVTTLTLSALDMAGNPAVTCSFTVTVAAACLVAGTVTWTGAADTDWDNPCNWDAFCVPGTANDVTIPDVTNDPTIGAGTAAVAKSVTVQSGAVLTIAATGSLTINGFRAVPDIPSITTALYNLGTVTNNGTLDVGPGSSAGTVGIANRNTVNNNINGLIRINNTSDRAFLNLSFPGVATMVNAGTLELGGIAAVVLGIQNQGAFTNTASGQISIDNATYGGILNFAASGFLNHGTITIGAIGNVGADAIRNTSTHFDNSGCTALIKILTNSTIINQGALNFDNSGVIIENASGNSNITTNTGVIQNLNGGTFTIDSGNAPITSTGDIWTGCVDTDWATAGNWLDGSVPTVSDDAVIPDVTNDPVVMGGTAAVAKSVTVSADAALTVEATDSLTINGFANNPDDFTTAAMHNSGTVTNDGIITIGSTASVSNHAIYNNGTVFNNADAQMHLDRADKNGIENNGAFTNAGGITIGAIDLGQYGIENNGTFDNAAGAEIAIDRSDEAGLINASGTFTNAGKITLGASVSVGTNGLTNTAVFNNQAGGEINLDRSFKVGLYNNGAFTNEAKIKIGQIASSGDYGLWQQSHAATFHNNAGGEIYIDRSGDTGLRNQFGTFNNAAKIIIGAVADVGIDGIYNSAILNNTPCTALIHIVSDDVVTNTGTFSNAGTIIENATGNSSISNNTGVVQNLNVGTFTIGSGSAPITTTGDIWTGCVDTDWATDGNWHDGSVPTATDDVLIPDVANDPVVMTGTAAVAQSVHVQPNAALTIAAMGSLTLEGDTGSPSGGMYNQGTVTNNGTILVGPNSSPGQYGVVNEATFDNNADSELHIDRTSNIGLWNRTAAAVLTNAGKITTGATVGTNFSPGIYNEGDIQNNGGEIEIDRYGGAGIDNRPNSTISNSGRLVVGKIPGPTNVCIYNFGHIENLANGEVEVDRGSSGIYNTTIGGISSSFTNAGKISIGQTASLSGPGIYNQSAPGASATFNNMADAEILLDRTSAGIHNDNNCSFDNAGLIKIATNALGTGFNPGIYNRSTFNNNAGGEIRMDSLSRTGLHHQSGTFTNGGTMILGINWTITGNYPGVYNEATFINQEDAEIHIDRFTYVGFHNAFNSSMTNAGLIKIGENILGGNNGLYNDGTFENQATGEIHVDNIPDANNTNGVSNAFGDTFTNAGKIFIGSTVGAGSTGLFNYGTFGNSGEITVDHVRGTSNQHGLYHSIGTFTNTGKIDLGNTGSIGNFGIFSTANFNNNTGGEISIDRCAIIGLRNGNFGSGGTFTNQGKLNIGANAGVGNWGLWNESPFNNSGELAIDNAAVSGLRHQTNTFTNTGTIELGGIANIGDWGLWNQSAFINNAGGNIHIDRTANTGLLNFSSTFTNNGIVTIGAETAVGDQAIYNQGTLANGTCAQLYIFAPLHNVSTLTNFGLFQVNTPALHTNTGFTNNGIIDYPQGNPIPNVTNNEIIIAPTTVNGCEVISPALTLGSPVDLTILGVFTDAAATISAGTYVVATNTFTPTSVLDEGTHDFFVKIEDVVDGCTRIVSWELTTQNCCDAPEAICKTAPVTAVLVGNSASIAAGDVDNGSTYECGLQSMTVSPSMFDCSDLGPQTVTLTVTDVSGNSDECTATVTVVDNTAPVISCPNGLTVSCLSNIPAPNPASVTASDNCVSVSKEHWYTTLPYNVECANRFQITRYYRVFDGSNNSATCSQIITVFDNTQPVFTFVPANVTVQCNSVPAVGTPSASDGCGGSVNIAYNGQTVSNVLCMDKYTPDPGLDGNRCLWQYPHRYAEDHGDGHAETRICQPTGQCHGAMRCYPTFNCAHGNG
ncbi:MAG: hypothetical protein IPM98_12050 [Lewinellaceae bacterium]|nr:hypothetical protein [Lewinellaceae bacterium]